MDEAKADEVRAWLRKGRHDLKPPSGCWRELSLCATQPVFIVNKQAIKP
jgi:hypothetical protein